MKIYDYKKTMPFHWCLVLCMSLFVMTNTFAQVVDDIVCDDVQISVGADCMLDLERDVFTEGSNQGTHVSFYFGANANTTGTAPYWGAIGSAIEIPCGVYTFKVSDDSGNSCWGTATIEDKLPPSSVTNPCPPDAPCESTCLTVGGDAANDQSMLIYGSASELLPIDGNDQQGLEDCSGIASVTIPPTRVDKQPENCEDPTLVYFIYSYRDGKGNLGADTLAYTVDKIDLDLFDIPDKFIGSCDEPSLKPADLEVVMPGSGLPTYNGMTTSAAGFPSFGTDQTTDLCNIIISYWDIKNLPACTEVEGCSPSRKVLREWTAIDWCTGEILGQGENDGETIQVLELKDTDEPENLEADIANMTLSVDPWNCAAEDVEVNITATDNCADAADLRYMLTGPPGTIITPSGLTRSGKFSVDFIGKGTVTLTATARDCCGNISEEYDFEVAVIDKVKPIAIAKEFTVVSLSQFNGTGNDRAVAKVFAESIDNGSYDKCTPVELQVRRDWVTYSGTARDICDSDKDLDFDEDGYVDGTATEASPGDVAVGTEPAFNYGWGPFVKFCCADVGQTIRVSLRVWDDANMDGKYDGLENDMGLDNFSITWGNVKVEDPNPPVINVMPMVFFCHQDREEIEAAITAIGAQVVTACGEETIEPTQINWFQAVDGEPRRGDFPGQLEKLSDEDNELIWGGFDLSDIIEALGGESDNIFPAYDYTCNYGFAWAQYDATGDKGTEATAYQLIVVQYKDDFTCDDVHDSEDLDGNGLLDDPIRPFRIETEECVLDETPEIVWDAGACELIGWTVETTEYNLSPQDGCKKIEHIYTVVDWCVYDIARSSQPTMTTGGSRGETLRGHDADVLFYDLFWKEWNWNNDKDNASGSNCFENQGDDRHASGKYIFSEIIKFVPDNNLDIEPIEDQMIALDNNCKATYTIEVDAGNECEFGLTYQFFSGEFPTGTSLGAPSSSNTYTSGEIMLFPSAEGMLTIDGYVKVWDGCGTTERVTWSVMLVDKKAPTPYCINLSSALMEERPARIGDGLVSMVELWAADFDNGSSDLCYNSLSFTFDNVPYAGDADDEHFFVTDGVINEETGRLNSYELEGDDEDADENEVEDLYFDGKTFTGTVLDEDDEEVEIADAIIYRWLPAGHSDNASGKPTAGKVFTCENTGAGETDQVMTVWDGKLNWDFCTVTLRLDGANDCGGGGAVASVAGSIATEAGSTVSGVSVELDNLSNPEYKLSDVTGNDGAYAFSNNPMYNSYDVSGVKGGDDDEGVSTLDLVMIQRHILDLAAFTSPYKVIASDINNDGSVKASDLIILRKLILGIYKVLPSNTSWKFVDGSQTLNVEDVLDTYSEVRSIADLDANLSAENFVAVKIGDVNGDARTNARGNRSTVRSNNTVALSILDRNVRAGEVVDITFASNDFSAVYGYQFTLELNGLQFGAVNAGSANMTDDNVASFGNTLNVSYSDINGLNASDNLFTITATATRNGSISDMVNIGTGLNSEAYVGTNLDVANVELTLTGEEAAGFSLGQNEPNPFQDFTVVGFTLPASGKAQITVYNVAGKVITLRDGEYAKGYNTERFTKAELGISGVMYYTLESGDFTATKKMIIIE